MARWNLIVLTLASGCSGGADEPEAPAAPAPSASVEQAEPVTVYANDGARTTLLACWTPAAGWTEDCDEVVGPQTVIDARHTVREGDATRVVAPAPWCEPSEEGPMDGWRLASSLDGPYAVWPEGAAQRPSRTPELGDLPGESVSVELQIPAAGARDEAWLVVHRYRESRGFALVVEEDGEVREVTQLGCGVSGWWRDWADALAVPRAEEVEVPSPRSDGRPGELSPEQLKERVLTEEEMLELIEERADED